MTTFTVILFILNAHYAGVTGERDHRLQQVLENGLQGRRWPDSLS